MKFQAEILEVKTRKTMSMDKIIAIKLETTDEQALELQRYIAEEVVTIEVKEHD